MNTDETITIYDVAREAGVSMATVSLIVWITVQMRLRVAWRVRKPLL